jgi:hypothetical protein
MDVINQTKELLGDPKDRIKLYDFVLAETKKLVSATSDEHFPVQGQWSAEEFRDKIKKYEEVSKDLRAIMALLAFWGESYNQQALTLPILRLTERLGSNAGNAAFKKLRGYPILLMVYSAGIAAVASGKFENLKNLLSFRLPKPPRSDERKILLTALSRSISEMSEMFKLAPGVEQRLTPRSDYLLNFIKPEFAELFGFSEEFDYYFDQFEVILALEHAHVFSPEKIVKFQGPKGRFVWMYQYENNGSPVHEIVSLAETEKEAWSVI